MLIELMLPRPESGIMAQSAPIRAAVPDAAGDAVGLAVAVTGPAEPVGEADVVFELPQAAAASARPASAPRAAGRVSFARTEA
ncbi:MAG TPA: hypothetical protein VMU94_06950 [Streptosporangiaceae bacterium]|nr:hypothetical protein [Streptosporangiaceae bacterium]